MSTHESTHNGCEIKIDEHGELTINGKFIEASKDHANNEWSSSHLPYSSYSSILELAKTIADTSPDFATDRE